MVDQSYEEIKADIEDFENRLKKKNQNNLQDWLYTSDNIFSIFSIINCFILR